MPINALKKMREGLDEIDRSIMDQIANRFMIAKQIDVFKAEHSFLHVDPNREIAMLDGIKEHAANIGLDRKMAVRLMRMIMDETAVANGSGEG